MQNQDPEFFFEVASNALSLNKETDCVSRTFYRSIYLEVTKKEPVKSIIQPVIRDAESRVPFNKSTIS